MATVFCQGCGWRCRYCHNPHLQTTEAPDLIPWSEVMVFLGTRRGLLDGVVFSGGEPTLQAALPEAMREVKRLGFRVGLHTGGSRPDRFAEVLLLLDWVGFDVKAPFGQYAPITGTDAGAAARESLAALLASGKDYEVRTTVHPALLDAPALTAIAEELLARGVAHYAVQAFRAAGCQDSALNVTASMRPPSLPAALQRRFTAFALR